MSRILFITRHYLSDNNGGANASKGFIHAFARIGDDLTLIYPEHEDGDSLKYVPSGVRSIPCYDHRSKLCKGLDIYRGRLHRFTTFIRVHLSQERYAKIVLDHSILAAELMPIVKKSGAQIITIHHNVERDYIEANQVSMLYRLPYNFYAKRAEREALLMSDLNLTLSENDLQTFKSWYPKKDLHLHTIGICCYEDLPEKHFERREDRHVFVVSGSLCFPQSLKPILHFLQHYYPLLRLQCPDACLLIAGRDPSPELNALCATLKDVVLIPNPEQMADVIAKADYYVCPIDIGSGIKLRLQDGLKQGLPILAHDKAAIGYESLVEEGALFTYRDDESFLKALSEMISAPHDPLQIYAGFQSLFHIDSLVSKLNKIIQ